MEARVAAVSAVIIITCLTSLVYQEAPDLGKHVAYFDLTVQALKTYLVEKYGLSGSDWDPFSYLGRPPLANYPVLPFLLSAGLGRVLGLNAFVATVASEATFWTIPVVVWAALRALGACSSESTLALLTYLMFFPICQFYGAGLVRLATSLSFSLMVSTVILWHSKIREVIKIPLCLTLSTAALYSNFIYMIPTLISMVVLESWVFALPIAATSPVLAFAGKVGKLLFDNLPESTFMAVSPLSVIDVVMVTATLFLLACFIAIAMEATTKEKVVVIAILVVIISATLSFVSPKAHYLLLSLSKTFTQLDMHRLQMSICAITVALMPRMSRKIKLSVAAYLLVLTALILIQYPIFLEYQVLGLYSFTPHIAKSRHYRTSEMEITKFSVSSPLCTASGHPTYILGGGFYQGCNEICLRIVSSILFFKNTPLICEPLMHSAQHQLFGRKTTEKVLSVLPVLKVSYGADVKSLRSYSDISEYRFAQKPQIRLTDAVPVRSFKAVYVGSYTDYSFLWLNMVRVAPPGHLPMIPLVRPYNVAQKQSVPVERLPWTGDILILDPSALKYPGVTKLIRRAKTVIVVWSDPKLDRVPTSKAVRVASRFSRDVRALGPVIRPLHSPVLRGLVRETCVKPSPARGTVQRLSNDRYRVNLKGAKFVIVPWAWAPFWAVNGEEGRTCPLGPYMLVEVDGKPATLHYVAWERHQSRAYALSVSILVVSMIAATMLKRTRIVDRGAEGRR